MFCISTEGRKCAWTQHQGFNQLHLKVKHRNIAVLHSRIPTGYLKYRKSSTRKKQENKNLSFITNEHYVWAFRRHSPEFKMCQNNRVKISVINQLAMYCSQALGVGGNEWGQNVNIIGTIEYKGDVNVLNNPNHHPRENWQMCQWHAEGVAWIVIHYTSLCQLDLMGTCQFPKTSIQQYFLSQLWQLFTNMVWETMYFAVLRYFILFL